MATKRFNITLMESQSEVVLRAGDGDGRKSDTLGASGVIDRDLARYYEALRRSRAKMRKLFTPDEVAAIVDNLNGVWLTHNPEISITGIPLNLADGIELDGLDKKWGVNAQEFLVKLRGDGGKIPALSFIDLCAIADAAERFWDSISGQKKADPRQALEG